MKKIGIAIHGGAGTIKRSLMTPSLEVEYRNALKESVGKGYALLEKGGSALDAVQLAVKILEDCPLFNAGRGSVFTSEGTHEMDAAIMCGATLDAGAIAGVRGVKNPVALARKVMNDQEFVLLCGGGAEDYGKRHGIEFEDDAYFYTDLRYNQWQNVKHGNKAVLDHDGDRKFGTVGAVAFDENGNLAAATSTGGLTNKRFGRLGDSAIIGSGNYANNKTCAISCTGYGEYFIRSVIAHDVSALMDYKGYSLKEASLEVLEKLTKMGGEGGFVAIDKEGNVDLVFNTEGMYRAKATGDGIFIGIYRDE